MRGTTLILLLAMGCASQPIEGGSIALSDLGEFQAIELENGTSVQMRFGIVQFPDGVVGLLVDYITNHDLGTKALQYEIPYVWWEAMPELKRRSLAQGWVRALDRIPKGEFKAEGYRACLAVDGNTLWLNLDGGLTSADRASGQRCLQSPHNKALQRTSNSSAQLTLVAGWRHNVSAGSGPVSAVAGR